MRRAASVSALVFLLAGTAHGALAAAAADAAAPATASDLAVEEVVVTAQRREERLQDVPISVTAVTAAGLQKQGVTTSAELAAAVPGLNLSKSSTVWQPFLRGVGTQTIQPGSDPSISVYMDGVYLSAPGALLFSFSNIERVEVLKGPQGTLFGRNATGGLIQVVTKSPTSTPTAQASVSFGSYNAINTNAFVSGGTEQVAASLALIYNNQTNKGWGTNQYVAPAAQIQPRTDVGIQEEFGLHAKLLVRPTDQASIEIGGLYLETNGDQYQYRNPAPGAGVLVSGTAPFFYTGGFYDTNTDIVFNNHARQYLFNANGTFEADVATFKSITSYLDARLDYVVPSDSSPQTTRANSFGVKGMTWKTFTQEVQVLSNGNSGPSWLTWIGGAFFLHSVGTFTPRTGLTLTDLDNIRYSSQTSTSYAVYAQGVADLGHDTKATLGLRESRDDITADQSQIGLNPLAAPTSSAVLGRVSFLVPPTTTSFNKLTWLGVLDHHFTEDVHAYVSISRGYKAGAWNHGSLCPTTAVVPVCPTVQPVAQPEVLDSYSIGLKSMLLDHRLRLNVDGYYYKYNDLQVSVVSGIPPVGIITNAAQATLYGLDVEGEGRITPTFSVNFNLALEHAEYDDFPGAIRFTRRTVSPYGNAQSTFNAAGNDMVRAPKISGNLGFDWTIPTSRGDVEVSGSAYYSGKYFWDVENRLSEDPYTLISGQIAWSPNDTWRLRLWGKNLGGVEYHGTQTSSAFGDFVSPAAPRTFGVAVDWKM